MNFTSLCRTPLLLNSVTLVGNLTLNSSFRLASLWWLELLFGKRQFTVVTLNVSLLLWDI